MSRLTISKRKDIFLFSFLCLWVMASIIGLLIIYIRQTPPDTYYTLGVGYLFDYYQYVSWIKSGQLGDLLLTNRYTEEAQVSIFYNPFFTLLGYLSRPFTISPFAVFHIFRLTGILLFLFAWYLLLLKITKKVSTRVFSIILFITTGSFWWYKTSNQEIVLVEPIAWIDNFNVLNKFFLSPHHSLALAGIMLALILIHGRKPVKSIIIPMFILITVAGFANPYVLSLINLVVIGSFLLQLVFLKKLVKMYFARFLFFVILTLPVIAYHAVIATYVYPWRLMFSTMFQFNPPTTLFEFLLSLGPLVPLSASVLLSSSARTNPFTLTLVSWAFLPLILYPLTNTLVPLNTLRVFQSYQYIPLVLLAALSVDRFTGNLKKYGRLAKIVPLTIAVGFIVYNTPAIYLSFQKAKSEIKPNYYNIYIPNAAIEAFNFLNKETPSQSVILSGEYISGLIPTFTHNRVILGRTDATNDYITKRDRAFAFLDGKLDEGPVKKFLNDYSIAYILFGVDTSPFEKLSLKSSPYLTEVFSKDKVSIVKVSD